MKTKLLLLFAAFISLQFVNAQEILSFNGYPSSGVNLTATTATVNDEIIIMFTDSDIINDFYTEGRTYIHLYGGLEVNGVSSFEGAPTFTDLASQPKLTLVASDTNASIGPNTYSLTFKLSQLYTGVSDGLNITGLNLIFQNEFRGGGNNQTSDLYIDLVDALKNSTLSNEEFSKNSISLNLIENAIQLEGLEYNEKFKLEVYNLSGKLVKKMDEKSVLNLDGLSTSVYILKLKTDTNIIINKKVIKE